ncbi:MAG TPA: hypothetical protein VIN57_05560 [Magnetovibrio sp.]
MFSLLNITPDNLVWFYLAPILVFGPIFIAFLWNFGLKNLFTTEPGLKDQQRLEREHNDRILKRRASKAGYHARIEHPATKPSFMWVGQGALYLTFAGLLGLFSAWPSYRYTVPGEAQIKFSISHPSQRVEACHKRTLAELAKLPPNMRAKMDCSRERWPLKVELMLDGALVFAGEAKAAGLRSDGSSSFYEKFRVSAGPHTLTVRMNDAGPQSPFTHTFSSDVTLVPAQNLVIGFHEDGSGFYLK